MSEQPLSFTRQRIKPINKLVFLSIISIILMVLDSRYAAVQQLKGYTATLLYPMQWLANQPVRLYDYAAGFLRNQNDLLNENRRLSVENMQLKLQLSQRNAQTVELSELKLLHQLKNAGIPNSTTAEIISNGKDPLSDKLIIDKGSRQGLRAGDAVIDQNGLIGQLTQVQPLSAELTLITNTQSVIPVMVARTGVRSLLYGTGNGVNLRYFPADADLRPNDVLLTSGLDSVYPAGIPVAKILAVQHTQGTPYYKVNVAALAAFQSSKYVLTLPQAELPQAAVTTASAPTLPENASEAK